MNLEIRTRMLTLDVVRCSWSNRQKEFPVHSLVIYTANWSLPCMESKDFRKGSYEEKK